MKDTVLIERDIKAPPEDVFDAFIAPEELKKWHNAGDGWSTPYAEVDPRVGGTIKIAYADPEGNVVFDLEANIQKIERPTILHYLLGVEGDEDARRVTIDINEIEQGSHLRLEFEIEDVNAKEMQRDGWTKHVDNLQELLESQKARH